MGMLVLLVTVIAFAAHVAVSKDRSRRRVVELALLYLLGVSFGLGTIAAGIFHLLDGPETARRIGWAAGSPFQDEVGVADIAFGITGVMCIFIRGNFWLAAVIANSAFLLGCMVLHVRSMADSGNLASYNIGPNVIISDLVMPLVLIALYAVHRSLERRP